MKNSPTQKELVKRLVALQGDNTGVSAARGMYTPYRTYTSWTNGERPIRGALRALIEAREELRGAWREIERLRGQIMKANGVKS